MFINGKRVEFSADKYSENIIINMIRELVHEPMRIL